VFERGQLYGDGHFWGNRQHWRRSVGEDQRRELFGLGRKDETDPLWPSTSCIHASNIRSQMVKEDWFDYIFIGAFSYANTTELFFIGVLIFIFWIYRPRVVWTTIGILILDSAYHCPTSSDFRPFERQLFWTQLRELRRVTRRVRRHKSDLERLHRVNRTSEAPLSKTTTTLLHP
jgi:hypothetical protein